MKILYFFDVTNSSVKTLLSEIIPSEQGGEVKQKCEHKFRQL